MFLSFMIQVFLPTALGAAISLLTSVIIGKGNKQNELDIVIAKDRIEAYKKVYSTVSKLQELMYSDEEINIPRNCIYYYLDNREKVKRCFGYPEVCFTFEQFSYYKKCITKVLNETRIFLDNNTVNELSFLDSYLSVIWEKGRSMQQDEFHLIIFLVYNEICEMTETIETNVQSFFSSNKKRTFYNDFYRVYEYEESRYKSTELYKIFYSDNYKFNLGDLPKCFECPNRKTCLDMDYCNVFDDTGKFSQ